jgi:endo-1,4-beta-xylanase
MLTTLNRRRFIAGSAAAALGAGTLPGGASAPTLASAAAIHDRFSGTAVQLTHLSDDLAYRDLVHRECSSITPELELKWAAVEPARGALSLTALDALAGFARDSGKRVHGHTLLWHKSVPPWAVEPLLAGDWEPLRLYISSVVPRLGDVVDLWDVVNEPIETGHREDGLRPSVFLRGFGPDYIPRALETARLFQPAAKLLINEYGLEYALPVENDRRYHLLRLLERLRSAGVPLDGIGLQAHLDLRKGRVDQERIGAFLDAVTGMGLAIVVTELDVREADYAADPASRDRAVADEVRRYLDAVLARPGVVGVTTWGLSDRYSWLAVTPEDLTRHGDAWPDGSGPGLNRGLPFDSDLRRKPMYDAIAAALSAG